ncbi:MAG: DUF547 domain-containing protein [Bacteriovoracia bacterium]
MQSYVHENGPESRVDYLAIKQNKLRLEGYLADLTGVTSKQYSKFTENQKLAFLINSYNAFTVKLVVDHYPVQSIKDIKEKNAESPWDIKFFSLLEKTRSLNELEHEMIRRSFNEPRVHFTLVCAARGCPALRNFAFRASEINAQLDDATARFLADSQRNRYDAESGRLYLSPIFQWYAGDFKKKNGSVEKFVSKYIYGFSPRGLKIQYTSYDWSLNEQKSERGDSPNTASPMLSEGNGNNFGQSSSSSEPFSGSTTSNSTGGGNSSGGGSGTESGLSQRESGTPSGDSGGPPSSEGNGLASSPSSLSSPGGGHNSPARNGDPGLGSGTESPFVGSGTERSLGSSSQPPSRPGQGAPPSSAPRSPTTESGGVPPAFGSSTERAPTASREPSKAEQLANSRPEQSPYRNQGSGTERSPDSFTSTEYNQSAGSSTENSLSKSRSPTNPAPDQIQSETPSAPHESTTQASSATGEDSQSTQTNSRPAGVDHIAQSPERAPAAPSRAQSAGGNRALIAVRIVETAPPGQESSQNPGRVFYIDPASVPAGVPVAQFVENCIHELRNSGVPATSHLDSRTNYSVDIKRVELPEDQVQRVSVGTRGEKSIWVPSQRTGSGTESGAGSAVGAEAR